MEGNAIEERQATASLLQENPITRVINCIEPETGGSATAVVVFSTFVAVCGSYVFGTAVGYSSPAESGILIDLGLSLAEYSFFWLNNDDWSNVRCSGEWADSRSHW